MMWKRRSVVIGAIALGAIVAVGIGWLVAERDARNVETKVEQRIGEGSKASCATWEIGEEHANSWMCTVESDGISDLCVVELDERDKIVSARGLGDEFAEAAGVLEARSKLCAEIIGGSAESSASSS